jgi:hypothetical protein
MATLCRTFPTEQAARGAVDTLTAAGVPRRDVCLLTGSRLHDLRREPEGTFYGTLGPEAPVGTFAGPAHPRWAGAGTYFGDASRQRQGSFADAERDVVVAESARTSGDRGVSRLLARSGVPDALAADLVAALHAGRAVVVAELAEIPPREAEAKVDRVPQVA